MAALAALAALTALAASAAFTVPAASAATAASAASAAATAFAAPAAFATATASATLTAFAASAAPTASALELFFIGKVETIAITRVPRNAIKCSFMLDNPSLVEENSSFEKEVSLRKRSLFEKKRMKCLKRAIWLCG